MDNYDILNKKVLELGTSDDLFEAYRQMLSHTITHYAYSYAQTSGLSVDDIKAYIDIALLNAMRKYDSTRGSFVTFFMFKMLTMLNSVYNKTVTESDKYGTSSEPRMFSFTDLEVTNDEDKDSFIENRLVDTSYLQFFKSLEQLDIYNKLLELSPNEITTKILNELYAMCNGICDEAKLNKLVLAKKLGIYPIYVDRHLKKLVKLYNNKYEPNRYKIKRESKVCV